MRTGELRAREDFDAILAATLSDHWTRTLGHTVVARLDDGGDGQLWQDHPLLTGVFADRPGPEVVRFLRDELRYSPVPHRAHAQWLVGTLCALGPALGVMARPLLRVSPAIPDADHLLVLTGHRRLRVLDFAQKTSLALVKDGFDPRCISREVAIRSGEGPFLPLGDVDPDGRWVAEPLVVGRSLPRIPGTSRRSQLAKDILSRLDTWQRRGTEEVPTAGHLEQLLGLIRAHLTTLEERHGPTAVTGVGPWLERLSGEVLRRASMEVSTTHGDLQPGNILVDLERDEAVLVDLEFARERFRSYDLLTWGLRARPVAPGLDRRLGAFVTEGKLRDVSSLLPEAQDPQWRRWSTAIFLLEELERLGEEATSGQPRDPGEAWWCFLETLATLGRDPGRLFPNPESP